MTHRIAIIEHTDGSKTKHTNVKSAGMRMTRHESAVRVVYQCGAEVLYKDGVSVSVGEDTSPINPFAS